VERGFSLYGLKKRLDLIIFNKAAHPRLLAEFKAPGIRITQSAFDQIAQYNMKWKVPYALLSNGQEHFCFSIDEKKKGFNWEERLPL
jgi:hypothetical protein